MPQECVLRIRSCTPDDRNAVLALAPRLTIGVAPWRDSSAVQRAVRGWLIDSLADPGTEVLVADDPTSGVVGVVTVGTRAHFTGEVDAYIGELVVAELHEQRGVGRALVSAAEEWAVRQGCGCITLETGAANADARAFYRRLGYGEEDVRLTRVLDDR